MHVKQLVLDDPTCRELLAQLAAGAPQLLLAFGPVAIFSQAAFPAQLAAAFPGAVIAGCTTAGEISGQGVSDDRVVLTAVRFDDAVLHRAQVEVANNADSHDAGRRLAMQLASTGAHYVLVLAPGVDVNGSALIDGMASILPRNVQISGGLAGDGGAFRETLTLAGDSVGARTAVAIGLTGPRLRIDHGSFHGWVPFGPARRVTRSEGNLLFELDGEPALDVYKRYLGDFAKDLPASGLLFPFETLNESRDKIGQIRTILGVDEAQGMLVLAGDIEENGFLRLMHASTDSLVDGAEEAARHACKAASSSGEALALLVSCVGRKLVMGVRVDEEVEAVADIVGRHATLVGFYSYGEISPDLEGVDCKLHNQTMTITFLTESA